MQVPEETLAGLVQAFLAESGLMREEAMLRWVDRSELEIISRLKDLQELPASRALASPPPP